VGEVHRHRGGFGAAGRRQAAAGEQQLGAAGVDAPAARGDRTESPRGLRRESRVTPRAGIQRPRRQIHAGAVRVLRGGAAQLRPQLHLAGGGLRRCLRGVSWDRSALGSVDPFVSWRALHRERAGPAEEVRPRQRSDAPLAPNPEEFVHPGWTRGWFYLRNFGNRLPAFTNKVVQERPEKWDWGVSPPAHQARLQVLTEALRHLARKGLTASAIIANFHRQRVIPLTERSLPIFDLTPEACASGSRTSPVLLPHDVTARRARNAVAEFPDNPEDLWKIKMRPDLGSRPIRGCRPRVSRREVSVCCGPDGAARANAA